MITGLPTVNLTTNQEIIHPILLNIEDVMIGTMKIIETGVKTDLIETIASIEIIVITGIIVTVGITVMTKNTGEADMTEMTEDRETIEIVEMIEKIVRGSAITENRAPRQTNHLNRRIQALRERYAEANLPTALGELRNQLECAYFLFLN